MENCKFISISSSFSQVDSAHILSRTSWQVAICSSCVYSDLLRSAPRPLSAARCSRVPSKPLSSLLLMKVVMHVLLTSELLLASWETGRNLTGGEVAYGSEARS